MPLKPTFITFLLIILTLAAGPVFGQAADDPPPTGALPLQAVAVEFNSQENVPQNIEPALLQLGGSEHAPQIVQEGLAQRYDLRLENGRVQVNVAAADHAAAAGAVNAAGGQVSGRSAFDDQLQAWVPPANLADLAADPAVAFVRRPLTAEAVNLTAGAVDSEGLAPLNAPAWHANGHMGAGTKIAVIDVGFEGYPALLGSELPLFITPKNFVDGQTDAEIATGNVHGTAVAEIVHDVAPQAQIFLIKINTNIDLEEAVAYAIENEIDIISTSLIWYNATPGDGSGMFADLVAFARDNGILWITAAGNDRIRHWGGTFNDPDLDGWHNFDGDQEINFFGPGDGTQSLISDGKTIRIYLRWNDWSAVDQDLNLALLRYDSDSGSWHPVATSQMVQSGVDGQKPVEMLSHTAAGEPAPYGVQVLAHSVTRTVDFDVFTARGPGFDKMITPRSLGNLADAPQAVTVAAASCESPYDQFVYSAEGPTNGAGGSAGAEGAFDKPEVTAYASISTATYAPSRFGGTSAAVPHVSGAAALALGANPGLTPDALEAYLLDQALDLGDPAYDTQYGHGRIYLPISPTAIELLPQASSPQPTGGASLLLALALLIGLTLPAYRLRRSEAK